MDVTHVRWVRLRRIGVIVVLGLLVGLAGTYWQSGDSTRRSTARPPDWDIEKRLGIYFDNPLGPHARPIPADAALQALRSCRCPAPPSDGPAPASEIAEAWADVGTGLQIGLRFPSGLTLTYSPDSRGGQEYADQVAGMIASDAAMGYSPFRLIDLRGTKAMVKDADANGPASISWIETGRLIALIGWGGESLDQLLSIAISMSPPQ